MVEALTNEENVRRIILAAFQGEHPGAYRLNLALKEAERIKQELIEAEIEELAKHYAHELTGE